MTMTCKINKLEKLGGQLRIFHTLFGRSATFYGHFRADTVTSEWSTRISSSIDLSHLSTEQHQKAVDLITEMSDVFSQDNEDIGDVQNCKMKLRLKDEKPVQKSYYSMPKPLHQEVKHYVEDLLNKGWITKSSSNYPSPVVAVRKNDGSLWLFCDYRALNNKTISDRHPLPRVQDAIDSLNGKKWFSLLDQQKAYHQIYLDPESRPLNAFANCIYYTVGLVRMGESSIWAFECASRISKIYGKLFD